MIKSIIDYNRNFAEEGIEEDVFHIIDTETGLLRQIAGKVVE